MIAEEILQIYYEGLTAQDACDVGVGRTFGRGCVGAVNGEEGFVQAWVWREIGSGCPGLFRVEELADGIGKEYEPGDEGDDVRQHG